MTTIEKIIDHGGYKEVRYEGRTVKLVFYVNTPEDPLELSIRVGDAIKAMQPFCPMTVGTGINCPQEEANDIWQWVLKKVADPKTDETKS